MRFSKDLVGKPIFSIDEGRHLGVVRDIYVDRELEWLAGVHLGKEGLLSRKSLLIPRDAIVIFGVDVVLTKNADVVTDDRNLPGANTWLRLEKLQGRDVDTPGGTKVGTIGDVLLDEEARIIGFSLARVFVEGPIAENPVIMRDALIDTGNEDNGMTIDLAAAERRQQQVEVEEVEESEAHEIRVPPIPEYERGDEES